MPYKQGFYMTKIPVIARQPRLCRPVWQPEWPRVWTRHFILGTDWYDVL